MHTILAFDNYKIKIFLFVQTRVIYYILIIDLFQGFVLLTEPSSQQPAWNDVFHGDAHEEQCQCMCRLYWNKQKNKNNSRIQKSLFCLKLKSIQWMLQKPKPSDSVGTGLTWQALRDLDLFLF